MLVTQDSHYKNVGHTGLTEHECQSHRAHTAGMSVTQGSHNMNVGHTGLTQQECWLHSAHTTGMLVSFPGS